jgi:hypothetical protein
VRIEDRRCEEANSEHGRNAAAAGGKNGTVSREEAPVRAAR